MRKVVISNLHLRTSRTLSSYTHAYTHSSLFWEELVVEAATTSSKTSDCFQISDSCSPSLTGSASSPSRIAGSAGQVKVWPASFSSMLRRWPQHLAQDPFPVLSPSLRAVQYLVGVLVDVLQRFPNGPDDTPSQLRSRGRDGQHGRGGRANRTDSHTLRFAVPSLLTLLLLASPPTTLSSVSPKAYCLHNLPSFLLNVTLSHSLAVHVANSASALRLEEALSGASPALRMEARASLAENTSAILSHRSPGSYTTYICLQESRAVEYLGYPKRDRNLQPQQAHGRHSMTAMPPEWSELGCKFPPLAQGRTPLAPSDWCPTSTSKSILPYAMYNIYIYI